MTAHHALPRGDIIIALVILVPLVLFAMQRWFGDGIPAVIILGTAAFVIFVLPGFPGSPVAFLDDPHPHPSQSQLTWLESLAFIVPVALAVGYKALRGDKPGVTGTRPVFRRRRRP